MKTWHFAVVGWLLLATAGCRSDPNVAILERELRRKEDEIYRLKWALEDAQDTSSCSANWRPKASEAEPEAAPRRRNPHGTPSELMPELPGAPSKEVPKSLLPPPGSLPPSVPEVPENFAVRLSRPARRWKEKASRVPRAWKTAAFRPPFPCRAGRSVPRATAARWLRSRSIAR